MADRNEIIDASQRNELLLSLFSKAARSFGISYSDVEAAALSISSVQKSHPWKYSFEYDGIDYDDRATRCGYLKRFAACHCALTWYSTETALSNVPCLKKLLRQETLRIVSTGGGPGNDLLGFCCAALNNPSCCLRELDVTNIDLKSGWEEAFDKVISLVSTRNYGSISKLFEKVAVFPEFVCANLKEISTPNAIESADVVIMTKVLSNVTDIDKDDILEKISLAMKKNAIFLFTDIDADNVDDYMIGMSILYRTERNSFEFLHSGSESIRHSTYEILVAQKGEEENNDEGEVEGNGGREEETDNDAKGVEHNVGEEEYDDEKEEEHDDEKGGGGEEHEEEEEYNRYRYRYR